MAFLKRLQNFFRKLSPTYEAQVELDKLKAIPYAQYKNFMREYIKDDSYRFQFPNSGVDAKELFQQIHSGKIAMLNASDPLQGESEVNKICAQLMLFSDKLKNVVEVSMRMHKSGIPDAFHFGQLESINEAIQQYTAELKRIIKSSVL